MTHNQAKINTLRKELRIEFSERLRRLDDDELSLLYENFEEHWAGLYTKLYDNVCCSLGFDLNEVMLGNGELVIPEYPEENFKASRREIERIGERQSSYHIDAEKVPSPQRRVEYVEHLKNIDEQFRKRLKNMRNNRKAD